jgi:hypothetical protein
MDAIHHAAFQVAHPAALGILLAVIDGLQLAIVALDVVIVIMRQHFAPSFFWIWQGAVGVEQIRVVEIDDFLRALAPFHLVLHRNILSVIPE